MGHGGERRQKLVLRFSPRRVFPHQAAASTAKPACRRCDRAYSRIRRAIVTAVRHDVDMAHIGPLLGAFCLPKQSISMPAKCLPSTRFGRSRRARWSRSVLLSRCYPCLTRLLCSRFRYPCPSRARFPSRMPRVRVPSPALIFLRRAPSSSIFESYLARNPARFSTFFSTCASARRMSAPRGWRDTIGIVCCRGSHAVHHPARFSHVNASRAGWQTFQRFSV